MLNHLNQQFNPTTPNSIWASDFTYIKVNGAFHYLCVVIDLFSRKVVGWNISNRHDVDLTMKAFENAYSDRCKPNYVLFHSDQGTEYTTFTFRHMKREYINRKTFHNQDELRLCCFECINRYNSKRPHSSLGDYTPEEIEEFYMERQAQFCLSINLFKKCVHLIDYAAD